MCRGRWYVPRYCPRKLPSLGNGLKMVAVAGEVNKGSERASEWMIIGLGGGGCTASTHRRAVGSRCPVLSTSGFEFLKSRRGRGGKKRWYSQLLTLFGAKPRSYCDRYKKDLQLREETLHFKHPSSYIITIQSILSHICLINFQLEIWIRFELILKIRLVMINAQLASFRSV